MTLRDGSLIHSQLSSRHVRVMNGNVNGTAKGCEEQPRSPLGAQLVPSSAVYRLEGNNAADYKGGYVIPSARETIAGSNPVIPAGGGWDVAEMEDATRRPCPQKKQRCQGDTEGTC